MELTRKQEEGLKIAIERYKNKEKYTVIGGYAGTGKSTLIKFIISALQDYDVTEEDVVFCAFTGKATQVLARKGNKNCATLHKLLYKSYPRPDGGFYRKPVEFIPYKIVVVDEVSMAPKELMDLLFTHDVYVIACGDPFQLPPVNKTDGHDLLDHPHIFLDEVMRQAKESEIIQLTMKIRGQESIDLFKGNEVRIHPMKELSSGMYTWADQILVGTNKTRIAINQAMREMLGKDPKSPCEGDKVICCRNYWETFDDDDNSLINGTIGYIGEPQFDVRYIPQIYGGGSIVALDTDFTTDIGTNFTRLSMDNHMIMTGDKCVDGKIAYRLNKNEHTKGIVPLEFTYGYAITCHKSQGSEWDKVLVIEEKFPFDKEEHARWLYTACTRASQKLVLVR